MGGRLAAVLALGAALPLLWGGAGCGGASERAPRAGGTAVIALAAEPDLFNPLLTGSAYATQLLGLMQDGLVQMGEDLEFHPAIAADWTFAADSLAVTFRLRPWVWEDGTPLTAHDVAASFALLTDPVVASPRRGGLANVAAVTALDAATVRYDFRSRRPLTEALFAAAHAILPAHLTDALAPARVREWPLNQRPLASGPYRLESWQHNRQLVLARNERYPGPRPRLDRLVFRIIPDETSRLIELETGGVDFVDEIPPPAARALAASGRAAVLRVGGRLVGQVQWNLRSPLLGDRAVRRALSFAIDREAFIGGLLCGYATPAASPIPPCLWAHDRDLLPDPHDPQRARQLLDAAGWRDADGDGVRERDGRRLSLLLVTRKGDPVREDGVALIAGNLREVGVEARPRILEFGAALDEVKQGRFDGYLGYFQPRLVPDPSAQLRSTATDRFNYGGYASATVDSLLDAALACPDRARAGPLWDRLQRVVAEDAPIAFLFYPETLCGVSPRLRGVRPHVLSPFNNVGEWWIAGREAGSGR